MRNLGLHVRIAALLLGAACSDGGSGPAEPIMIQPGRINVSVQATGGDPDDNGYEVVVGSGAVRKAIGANGTVGFDFAPGTHSVKLEGVAQNCAVTGANPVTVTVSAGSIAEVAFAVACQTTGIDIITRTTGFNMPGSYQLLVDNPPPRTISANGSLIVSRLEPGSHTVTLSVAIHCTVVGTSSITVAVANRTVTPVRFEIECGAVVRLEKIAYTILKKFAGFESYAIGLVRPDGTSPTELPPGRSPSWSPDGTRLVFSNTTCTDDGYYYYPSCNSYLEITDPETRAVTSLANSSRGTQPAWSPLGDEIAFIHCCDSGVPGERLYILRLDGSPSGGPRTHLPVQSAAIPSMFSVRDPAWSPDGQRLVFTCAIQALNDDICVIRRDGTGLVRLTSNQSNEQDPAWSPDGRTIAFTSYNLGPSPQIAFIAPEGGAVTPLTSGLAPAWSRDGKKLVFERSNGLFTINADGSGAAQLTTGPAHDPAWRP